MTPPDGATAVTHHADDPSVAEATARTFSGAGTGDAGRIAAIDGMRALAVAAVAAFHLGATWLSGGFLGVDLFFVISGFVITRLLLASDGAPGSVRTFWERRARRLLPQVLLVVAAMGAWALVTQPAVAGTVRGQGLAALLYVANWYNVFATVGYWDAGLAASPLNHLWSLAIEEQFYVLWPIVVLLVRRRAGRAWRSRLQTVAVVGVVASFGLQVLLAQASGTDRAYYGTDTRLGAILIGALVALRTHARAGRETERPPMIIEAATYPAVLVLGFLWATAHVSNEALFRGPLVIASLAGGVVVWSVAAMPDHALTNALGHPALVAVGRRSYAIYLWHFPVLVLVDEAHLGRGGVALLATRLLATAVLAEVTLRLVEDPIRHRTALAGGRLLAVGAFAVVAAAVLLAQVPSTGDPWAEGSMPLLDLTRADGATVMVVGDSWSRNLGVGMRDVADGRVNVLNLGIGGCGIADPARYRVAGQPDFAPPVACQGWRARWRAAARTYRPDAVVVQVGNWDQALQQIDGAWLRPCDPAFDRRYARKLDQAIAAVSSAGAKVFITNVRDGDHGTRPLSDCMNRLLDGAVARHPGTAALDLRSRLCTPAHRCPASIDHKAVYDETGHLTRVWRRRVARWVLAEVLASTTTRSEDRSAGTSDGSSLEAALPTGRDLAGLGATGVEVDAPRAASQALSVLTGTTARTGVVRQRGIVQHEGDVTLVATVVTTDDDRFADLLATAAARRYLAETAGAAYISTDQLVRVMVHRGPKPSVFVLIRKVEAVMMMEVQGLSPQPDTELAGVAEVLAGRLAEVPAA